MHDVQYDVNLIEHEASALGLYLNHSKSEMICAASASIALLSHVPADLCRVSLDNATLLGSPVGCSVSIDTAVRTKTDALRIMKSRLCYLSKLDALICFATLLQYQRSCPFVVLLYVLLLYI